MIATGADATAPDAFLLVLAAVLIAVLTAMVTAIIIRQNIKADVESHIKELYSAISEKSVAAAAADYNGTPYEVFELVKIINERLGPLIELGGPLEGIVGGIRKALNRASSFTTPKHPTPDEGTSTIVMVNPPKFQTTTHDHRSANGDLQKAANEFNVFWKDKFRVQGLIRSTIISLRGKVV